MQDTLDLRPWIKAAPLDAFRANLQNYNREMEEQRAEDQASMSAEDRERLARINEMLSALPGVNDEIDIPDLHDIVSPVTMALIEQYREQNRLAERGWSSRPVDIFVWALGEAPVRSFTKIGGLPYRPADLPWPKIAPEEGPYASHFKTGEPMTFLAQINFSGSRDLYPELPADVLLVFAENEEFCRPEGLHFEWYPLGLKETDLISTENVPAPSFQFVTCHGCRYRTVDYAPELPQEFDRYHPQRHAARLDATKIGGFPTVEQMTNSEFDEWLQSSGLRFLAQIKSIWPRTEQYYPWLNWREPLETRSDDQTLNFVDDGSIYLLLNGTGEVTWHFECG